MGKMLHCEESILYEAILTLKTVDECKLYFEDVCTIKEIKAMAQRIHVACQLDEGRNYLEVCESTGASSATISRVNKCLNYGEGGYRTAMERLKEAGKVPYESQKK